MIQFFTISADGNVVIYAITMAVFLAGDVRPYPGKIDVSVSVGHSGHHGYKVTNGNHTVEVDGNANANVHININGQKWKFKLPKPKSKSNFNIAYYNC